MLVRSNKEKLMTLSTAILKIHIFLRPVLKIENRTAQTLRKPDVMKLTNNSVEVLEMLLT